MCSVHRNSGQEGQGGQLGQVLGVFDQEHTNWGLLNLETTFFPPFPSLPQVILSFDASPPLFLPFPPLLLSLPASHLPPFSLLLFLSGRLWSETSVLIDVMASQRGSILFSLFLSFSKAFSCPSYRNAWQKVWKVDQQPCSKHVLGLP